MWTVVKSTKCCATCANWGGERKAHGSASEAPSASTRGKCYEGVPADASQGPVAMKGACPKYRPWGALK